MPKFVDITGQRFGRLVALRTIGVEAGRMRWLVRCDCGTEKPVDGAHMRYGRIVSCGCYLHEVTLAQAARNLKRDGNPTHGMSRTRIYAVWKSMHQRCRDPKDKAFKHYGGRGIAVCERWADFAAFYADMGEPNGLTLDRIDVERGYSPDNCRWATWAEQQTNRRSNGKSHFARQRVAPAPVPDAAVAVSGEGRETSGRHLAPPITDQGKMN